MSLLSIQKKTPRRALRRFLCRGILTLLLAALVVGGAYSASGGGIYHKLLRLHVLAASDSAEDQALKLEVRDAILDAATPYLEGCRSAVEAEAALEAHRTELLAAASERIAAAGHDESVDMVFSNEYYPTREYENVTLPAGRYRSLQVKIGEAQGQNWWCVLYPPLCLAASAAPEESKERDEDALLQAGLTKEETAIITGYDGENGSDGNKKFTLRFRFLELFGELRETLGF